MFISWHNPFNSYFYYLSFFAACSVFDKQLLYVEKSLLTIRLRECPPPSPPPPPPRANYLMNGKFQQLLTLKNSQ
jgi:hypothetical protein